MKMFFFFFLLQIINIIWMKDQLIGFFLLQLFEVKYTVVMCHSPNLDQIKNGLTFSTILNLLQLFSC